MKNYRVVTSARPTSSSRMMSRFIKKILYIATIISISCFYFHNLYYVQQSLNKSSLPELPFDFEYAKTSTITTNTNTNTAHTKSVQEKRPNSITTNPKKSNLSASRCALLFFGLPKQLKSIAYPSIHKHILQTNPDCDVYVHTYNVSILQANGRNKEPQVKLSIDDVYLLTTNKNHVTITTNEQFYQSRNLTYYHQYFPFQKKTWEYPQSLDNMLKQWHSIESVWKLMEDIVVSEQSGFEKNTNGPYYTRVGIFRSDLKYENPIHIISDNDNDDNDAVIPDFGLVNTTIELNDRMFYGSYTNAYRWSNRFEQVPSYVQTTIGRDVGLHSETFLHVLLQNVRVTKAPICAQRIRVTGKIQHDCWCNPIKPRLIVCPWWVEYLEGKGVHVPDLWKPPKVVHK